VTLLTQNAPLICEPVVVVVVVAVARAAVAAVVSVGLPEGAEGECPRRQTQSCDKQSWENKLNFGDAGI
jgi:hypothetical protein